MSSSPLISKVVASSVVIVKEAGRIIKDVMQKGDLAIIDKGINDLQTKADRAAQYFIISSLSRLFPDIKIIGEEENIDQSAEHVIDKKNTLADNIYDSEVLAGICPDNLKDVSANQITIWVDPLDGTSDYTKGFLDHVTVLVGVAVNETAVAGIIHQPYYGYKTCETTGRTLWGIVGGGTGGFTVRPPPVDKKVIVTTASHSNEIVEAALSAIDPDEVIRVGGAGHKVLLLLDGIANAYIYARSGSKRWDTCAPEAVLIAAGGWLTDMNGKRYSYAKDTTLENTAGILATALKGQHQMYFDLIPKEVKILF